MAQLALSKVLQIGASRGPFTMFQRRINLDLSIIQMMAETNFTQIDSVYEIHIMEKICPEDFGLFESCALGEFHDAVSQMHYGFLNFEEALYAVLKSDPDQSFEIFLNNSNCDGAYKTLKVSYDENKPCVELDLFDCSTILRPSGRFIVKRNND